MRMTKFELSSKSPWCEGTHLSVVITGSAAFILASHIPPARRTILVRCEKFCTKKDPGSETGLSTFEENREVFKRGSTFILKN